MWDTHLVVILHYRSRLARWLLPKRYVAITLGKHVLTREPELDARVLRHESKHIEQWRRYGLLGFLARYLWYHLRYGYAGNPLEIEARLAESEAAEPKNDLGTVRD